MPGEVRVDGESLTPAGVEAVAREGAAVAVPEVARDRGRECL